MNLIILGDLNTSGFEIAWSCSWAWWVQTVFDSFSFAVLGTVMKEFGWWR